MAVSYKMLRAIGLLLLNLVIVALGIIFFMGSSRINTNLSEMIRRDRPVLDDVVSIWRNFSYAENSFYAFVRGERMGIKDAVVQLDSVIKSAEKLQDKIADADRNTLLEFIESAKRFKIAVIIYSEESIYDPTGSDARDMEDIALAEARKSNLILHSMGNRIMADIRASEVNMLIIIKNNQRLLFAGVLSGLFIGIMVAFFLDRALSVPIKRLIDGTRRVAKGDLDFRVKVEYADEIGYLANSFNSMTEDLRASEKKLKEIAALGHKRVLELSEANKKLKDMQNMFIQAEKLNAVGRLAGGVAHEVRNPLATILQAVDYLEDGIGAGKDKHIIESLNTIKKNINRANDIIGGLVDFSKMSNLKYSYEDIKSVIENSLILIRHEVKLDNVKIVKQIEDNLPKVSIDSTKMEQVFINIFLNALQAMPNGGELFIRGYLGRLSDISSGVVRRSEDNFDAGEKALIVKIEDTGEGISKEDIEKVFDPFFTTKSARKGTGLGLSVTKNIISLHRGFIGIDSRKGKGTKISIALKVSKGDGYGKEKDTDNR